MGIREKLIPITKCLKLNEVAHTYSLGDLILPSVSEIIKPLSTKIYGDIDDMFLQSAAQRGTNVHFDIEQFLKTGWMPTLDENTEGYLKAFFKAYDEQIKGIDGERFSELKIHSPSMLYAGTLDLMIVDNDNNATIIDFKTTVKKHPKLWSVQLTGYKKIIEEIGINVKQMFVLQLKKDGKYELVELEDMTGMFMACYLVNKFNESD